MNFKHNILKRYKIIYAIILVVAILDPEAVAQNFSVSSLRLLPNDVSAFIEPVADLNGEDCALIKIQAIDEFAFSTPLGIVKRIDKIGEIWLYIPRGSKKITLKHPDWGVIRDFKFPIKIDSHMTYELVVDAPERISHTVIRETIIDTVFETLRDTLVVTRIDTLLVAKHKMRTPFSLTAMAGICFGGNTNTLAGGIMLIAMQRHGAWLHFASDFGKTGTTIASCDKIGGINGYLPFYSGNTRHSCYLASAGAIHKISNLINIFEGIGYGKVVTAWQLAESEGFGYVKNSYYSYNGILFQAGVMVSITRFAVSASAISIKGRQWFGSFNVGYKF